mmetsp:Transcript_5516/g.8124  ORF Transcript_5516/g.8124 Transcript_5516/m.8124 type:complete len:149 (-) Transcript_5516:1087-1533(-)
MRLSCNNTTILLLLSLFSITSAFTTTTTTYTPQRITSSSSLFSSEEEEGDTVLYSDEDYDDEEPKQEQSTPWKKNARWNSLNPRVKLRIIQEQQNKAIENKQKREPAKDKQRRTCQPFFFGIVSWFQNDFFDMIFFLTHNFAFFCIYS